MPEAAPGAADRCWWTVGIAATGLLGGSGFLAVYLFGLIVANRAAGAAARTLGAMDGYAWLGRQARRLEGPP